MRFVRQHRGASLDRVQRRPDFVRGPGQKFALVAQALFIDRTLVLEAGHKVLTVLQLPHEALRGQAKRQVRLDQIRKPPEPLGLCVAEIRPGPGIDNAKRPQGLPRWRL